MNNMNNIVEESFEKITAIPSLVDVIANLSDGDVARIYLDASLNKSMSQKFDKSLCEDSENLDMLHSIICNTDAYKTYRDVYIYMLVASVAKDDIVSRFIAKADHDLSIFKNNELDNESNS